MTINEHLNTQAQYHLIIHGTVQGVFFRKSSLEIATQLNLHGWVNNNKNKTVSLLIRGKKENCKKMIKWCHKGPPQAKVSNVIIRKEHPNYPKNSFIIK